MQQSRTRRTVFVLSAAFVAFAVVAALLGAPATSPVQAAAPVRKAGEVSNGWTLVFSAPAYDNGTAFHFYGLTFATRDVGFAYGGDIWDGNAGPGRVYRTKDGGKTWGLVHQSNGWKVGMACADDKHCWVGGRYGQIYYTEDGGDHWSGAYEYTWQGMDKPPIVQTPVPFSAWMRSAGVGPNGHPVIFGATDNTILHSDDGLHFYNYWPMLPNSVATWGVDCPSETVCYGGQINQFIVKTTDGGKSWAPPAYADMNGKNCLQDKYPNPDPNLQPGVQRRYYGLSFIDEKYGFAVGTCGMIYVTNDGAASRWKRQMPNLSEEISFRRVQAFSKNNAIAVGGEHPNPAEPADALNAVIYRTTDGAKLTAATWVPLAAPDTNELHGLAAFSDATFVADWAGNVWRWDGELIPIPNATNTPVATETPTATPTATTTATATATETATATPTATSTPSTGSAEVHAFYDVDLNGWPSPGDTLLSGVGYTLYKDGSAVTTAVTGANGLATFSGLQPGAYRVDETTLPAGYTPSHSSLTFLVEAGYASVVPFPHRANPVTATPTATPSSTAQAHRLWLPLLVQ